MNSVGIDHVNLGFPADRLDEVLEFYVDTLGFDIAPADAEDARSADPELFSIDLGNGFSLYVNPIDEAGVDVGSYRHMALRIPESPPDVRDLLVAADIEIASTATRERASWGPYTSFYVRDPFGYPLELMAIGDAVDTP